MRIVIDTSVLVGSLDARDSQHARAAALVAAIDAAGVESLLLDCVAVECIGVLWRRRAERRKAMPLPDFSKCFPPASLSRAYPLLLDSWPAILGEVSSSDGRLNAHDALILMFTRRERVPLIATFDADLGGHGIDVVGDPAELTARLLALG